MGNRAVIATRKRDLGIYLHWNGGRDSVQGFLTYCKMKGFRSPESDSYGWARLCQIIANSFGGSLSVGFGRFENLDVDNGDNGTYIIENWEIVDREYYNGLEQNEYKLEDVINSINESQPEKERLAPEEIENYFNQDKTVKATITIEFKKKNYAVYEKALQMFLDSIDTISNSKIDEDEEA